MYKSVKKVFRKGLLEDLASRADSHSGQSEKKELLLSHLCFFFVVLALSSFSNIP